jgi:hypothetical protein
VNLDHTVITAPIDGLVISRNVDVGQTVAASMQAPTLFVLAADLTKMQVVANLDESDVGRIRPKQTVTFRVDAYPTDTFRGTVSQVRLEPKVQQNVVTYATVIDVPNNDLRLKPGMTANVNVEISRASNVLRVPNSALRFRPSNDVFAALGQTPPEPQGRGGAPGGGRRGGQGAGAPASPETTSRGAAGSVNAPPAGAQASPAAASTASRGGGSGGQQPPAARADVPNIGQGNAPVPRAEGSAVPAPDSSGRAKQGGSRQGGGAASGDANASPGGDQGGADRQARFNERLQNMSPEERDAALARMRERGFDPTAPGGGGGFGGRGGGPGSTAGGGAAPSGRGNQPGQAAAGANAGRRGGQQNTAAADQGGPTTIDALFAPLARTETFGRAWLYVDKQLRQVRLRLGISDGQNTELIEGDLHEGSEVVTNVVIAGQTTRPATTAFPGFGQPQRGGFPGGGFPGGGGGGAAGRGGGR